MFTEERPSFTGRYYRIERALNEPRPVQPGGPKILVGGGGEQRTLRLAARHADMTHWFVSTIDEFKHKLAVLEQHCQAEGRDPASHHEDDRRAAHARARRAAGARARAPEPAERATHDRGAGGRDPRRVHGAPASQGFVFRNPNLTTPELLAAAGRVKKLLA